MEKYHSPPLSSENLLWLRLGTNFSGFYVNGKFYYKLTGIAIHYKDVSLRLENTKVEQKLTPPPCRLVSDETVN